MNNITRIWLLNPFIGLGWIPEENFESGQRKTVQWYLDNLV